MSKIESTTTRAGLLVCCFTGLLLPAQRAAGQDQDNFWQHLRIGAPVTFNVRANFSENGQFMLPAGLAGATGVSGVNHVYDDGFVKVDQTGNAGGFTSYWGYQNAAQYNSAAQTLTMHSVDSYTASGSATSSGSAFVGFEAAYGTDIWKWKSVHVGWEAGFGLLPVRIRDSETLSATVNESAYSFDTTGIAVMPTAPYSGGPGGVGPTIHDVATAQAGSVVAGTVTGSRLLDVVVYTFRLGPTIYWDINSYLGLTAGAGPVVGIVSGNYDFNETILTPGGGTASNSGKIGLTRTVFGGYVNANLIFHVVRHGDLYLGAQYMPLGGAGIDSGGRQARLDLSGALQATVGVNWPF